MSEDGSHRRSVYCPVPETRAAMHERARKRDMSLSRLIVELARADDLDRHPLVLSEAEQRAMRDDVGECAELVRAMRQGLPGCGGVTLFDALDLLAEERRR